MTCQDWRVTDAPSWWWADLGGLPAPRPALDGDREADVCVVGAGYTGLWTAYELLRADPSLSVVVLEREVAGFGASGRNGGWVLGEVSTGVHQREVAGEAAVAALERAIQETVDEVGAACAREGIECDFVKSGSLTVAQTEPQLARLRSAPRGELLDVDEAAARVRVAGLRGARYTPHCARVQPAKLARGLAAAVERHGGTIHEGTAALEIGPRSVRTSSGTVRARWVVRATEGYTAALPGLERALLPLSSSMIVTEPLDAATWAQIGWEGCETLDDAAHAYIYAQRTADGRIAIGGRGRPYRFGSGTDRAGEIPDATVRQLRARLTRCSRSCATCASTARGPASSAWRATGPRRCTATATAACAGPAATRARASPPPTSPPGPCATSSSTATPSSPACPGSATAPAAGSPSRCAGWRSRRSTAPSARRTRSRTARASRRGWRGPRELSPAADVCLCACG
jgi:glycine/D-amino acid oxidase-like deaminating enzyme